jgi:hypothetical protein
MMSIYWDVKIIQNYIINKIKSDIFNYDLILLIIMNDNIKSHTICSITRGRTLALLTWRSAQSLGGRKYYVDPRANGP